MLLRDYLVTLGFIPGDESGIGEYIDRLDKTESEHGIKKMD